MLTKRWPNSTARPAASNRAILQWLVFRVYHLVHHRGAYLRSAVLTVLHDAATSRRIEALTKAYHALKTPPDAAFYTLNADVLARDVARLPITTRHKK